MYYQLLPPGDTLALEIAAAEADRPPQQKLKRQTWGGIMHNFSPKL